MHNALEKETTVIASDIIGLAKGICKIRPKESPLACIGASALIVIETIYNGLTPDARDLFLDHIKFGLPRIKEDTR